jgi:hypothetical protein
MVLDPSTQTPARQTLPPTTVLPPSQRPAAQTLPSGYRRQPPLPSQVPSSPQPAAGSCLHCSGTAGGTPAGTGAQRPGRSGRLQRWQVPVQPLLQQTPSTQNPDWHSAAQAQAVPLASLSARLLRQLWGAASRTNASRTPPSGRSVSRTTGRASVRQPTASSAASSAATLVGPRTPTTTRAASMGPTIISGEVKCKCRYALKSGSCCPAPALCTCVLRSAADPVSRRAVQAQSGRSWADSAAARGQ